MPQTREAISHAQSAGVPMIFAINKMDKDGANPEGVRTQLSEMNVLVESWGGKFQDQEISAKKGLGVDELLEKILLEADMMDLKANPNRLSSGTVIEAALDKGRGYVATVLVTAGTLNVGDFLVAGSNYGKIKAMYDHTGSKVIKVYPGEPVQVLGLNGAPSAGENFKEFDNEQDAKQVAYKRSQIEREQGIRTKKHITLDEIGRRLALGTFKELNVIIKGDMDGSVQALSDSLTKLSTQEIQVNILHKAIGAITESDVLLASASDAIVIGFQVRPTAQAKVIAEREAIDIRHYSVIYQAIDEIKAAMEGMLEPTVEEKITGNLEIREVFKITKVGSIAGCFVTDGKVYRTSKIRIIREGIVVHTGKLASLKRFKDDVKEVVHGQDCGLNIDNYNDILSGDVIEAYEEVEIKRTLS
jgi:translation initiation factor IF-2